MESAIAKASYLESKMVSNTDRINALEERLAHLSAVCLGRNADTNPLDQRMDQAERDLIHLSGDLEREQLASERRDQETEALGVRVDEVVAEIRTANDQNNLVVAELRATVAELRAEMRVLQLAIGNNMAPANGQGIQRTVQKPKVPEPKQISEIQ